MKRRRAETFTEFLVAMVLFALIMAGVFQFTANQTMQAARIKDWDFFMFYAQQWINENRNDDGTIKAPNEADNNKEKDTDERGIIEFVMETDSSTQEKILTVRQKDNPKQSMKFTVSSN